MQIRGHDDQSRPHIVLHRRLLQLRQEQQTQEESAGDIRRHMQLVLLRHLPPLRHQSRVLEQHIQPVQIPLGLGREPPHGFIAREIERPHFHGVFPAPLDGGNDVAFGHLAFFRVADREDDLARAEADEVTGGFEAETRVAARNDDGLAGEIVLRDRWGDEELGVEEAEDVGQGHGCCYWIPYLLCIDCAILFR